MVKVLFYQTGVKEELREQFNQMVKPFIEEVVGIRPKAYLLDMTLEKFKEIIRGKPFWIIIDYDLNRRPVIKVYQDKEF
ncbi:MAG: hypothetical protein C0169_00310 [Thermodesulfobacterium geofontis]|uniref:Uncharacterized protein n=1 Tax=Thermodesulfobacterium geofontis TaxID=1295609 RepID=A0A2N7QGP8_9BACT|nr:MAG: hypothetical protein C0169_00310 [Thermodesulfobacterium geofontis]